MTSVIPNLLREYKKDSDKLWMAPGIVFRRDVRDKTHVGEPHQMDIWYLTKTKQTRENLLALVQVIVSFIEKHTGKQIKWRYNETSHNYTDDGIEVEIQYNGVWLEILECGLISKQLLNNNNLDEYSGLALGMGLERLVMIIKQIDDIRVLLDNRDTIQRQMNGLKKYKQVSNQPATKRDLFIAISEYVNEEELTEMILDSLDKNLHSTIESIKVTSETEYSKLPQIAIERLGIVDGQKNVLLRVVLRDLAKTLESHEANAIYTTIYSKIHQGTAGYFM